MLIKRRSVKNPKMLNLPCMDPLSHTILDEAGNCNIGISQSICITQHAIVTQRNEQWILTCDSEKLICQLQTPKPSGIMID